MLPPLPLKDHRIWALYPEDELSVLYHRCVHGEYDPSELSPEAAEDIYESIAIYWDTHNRAEEMVGTHAIL